MTETLEDLELKVARLENKLTMMRQEIMQCLNDYKMWQTAHGSDYPMRRSSEIREKMEAIEKV